MDNTPLTPTSLSMPQAGASPISVDTSLNNLSIPNLSAVNLNVNVGSMVLLSMFSVVLFFVGYFLSLVVDKVIGVAQGMLDSQLNQQVEEEFVNVKVSLNVNKVIIAGAMLSLHIALMNMVYSLLMQVTTQVVGSVYGLDPSFVGGGIFFLGGVAQAASHFRANLAIVHAYIKNMLK